MITIAHLEPMAEVSSNSADDKKQCKLTTILYKEDTKKSYQLTMS